MSVRIQTTTRYSNGFVVYSNDSRVASRRRRVQLRLVWDTGQIAAAVAAARPVCPTPLAQAISADPIIDSAAQHLATWLEAQYMENCAADYSDKPVPIVIPNRPHPDVLDLTYRILHQRGWIINVRSRADVTMIGGGSAVVAMRLAHL